MNTTNYLIIFKFFCELQEYAVIFNYLHFTTPQKYDHTLYKCTVLGTSYFCTECLNKHGNLKLFKGENTPMKMSASSILPTHLILTFGYEPQGGARGARGLLPCVRACKALESSMSCKPKKEKLLIEKTTLYLKVEFPIIKRINSTLYRWNKGKK